MIIKEVFQPSHIIKDIFILLWQYSILKKNKSQVLVDSLSTFFIYNTLRMNKFDNKNFFITKYIYLQRNIILCSLSMLG